MRARDMAAATVLALLASGLVTGMAVADDDTVPSRADVHDARTAVRAQADDVASVRARLAVANQRLQQSAVAAAQAAEAFNGARWRAGQARDAAAAAQVAATAAQGDVERQREAYSDAVVSSYEMAPELTALAGVLDSDGIDTVIQRTETMRNATDAIDGNYDEFRAAAVVADVAQGRADRALADAERAEQQARRAQQAAQAAADAAASDAQAIADEKTALIARLAELENVSVRLAQRRQAGLEARAARAAAAAAQQQEQEQEAAQSPAKPSDKPTPSEQPAAPTTPSTPTAEPSDEPSDEPSAPPATTPAPRSGAQAAIAFARAQLGEPYRWGAAGPSSWDCSGLTAGAWRAGGTSLPHYSVAQYEQSTPISAGQLQPGDLVFWGSSSDPGSIYHVALYVGGGRIIHAPRTGKPVTEESMYYWIPPTFYARP